MKKNVLLIYGGGGPEHEISEISSRHIKDSLSNDPLVQLHVVKIDKDLVWKTEGGIPCDLTMDKCLIVGHTRTPIHAAIPCIHGWPGETGDIQSFFELIQLPYLGCTAEGNRNCFNKLTTKLWLTALGIPNTPFVFLTHPECSDEVRSFQRHHGRVFVKASSQGSSVGTYPASTPQELEGAIRDAFQFSDFVIVEKALDARELEVSTYEYEGQLYISAPGEIVCPSRFYTYEEEYNSTSHTETHVTAKDIPLAITQHIQDYARKAFTHMKLRHLSRMDFFWTQEGTLYLNEINTFPGMTSISLFPKMMEARGHRFSDFLSSTLNQITTGV